MHRYLVEFDGHRKVQFALVAASVLLAWVMGWVVRVIGNHIPLIWLVDVPAVWGFYSLLLWWFDHYLWRHPLVRRLFRLRVPILDGDWEVSISSSKDGFQHVHRGKAVIHQTWLSLGVALTMQASRSDSLTATMRDTQHGILLSYEYHNSPVVSAPGTMLRHDGYCRLLYDPQEDTISGDYFTGRDRMNHGEITLRRRSSR